MRQSQYANNPPPPPPAAYNRHSDSVRSGDPITGTNVYGRDSGAGGWNNHYDYVPQHQQQGPGNGNHGWVDESSYNGPYYGRQEAYGR